MAIEKNMCRAGDVVRIISKNGADFGGADVGDEIVVKDLRDESYAANYISCTFPDGEDWCVDLQDLEFVERKIRAGDTVRVVDNCGAPGHYCIGEICVVEAVIPPHDLIQMEGKAECMYVYRFERVGNNFQAPVAAPAKTEYKVGDTVECIADKPSYSANVTKGRTYKVVTVYDNGDIETTNDYEGQTQTTKTSDWKLVSRELPTERVVSVSEMIGGVKESLPDIDFANVLDMFSIKLISSGGLGVQLDKQYVTRAEVMQVVSDALDMAGA